MWDGFIFLDRSRQRRSITAARNGENVIVDMPCPISLVEITAYLDFFNLDDTEDRKEFLYLISALDSHRIKRAQEVIGNGHS